MAQRRGVAMTYSIKADEAFVGGKTPENAARLLDLAREAGLSTRVVRTTTTGFIVPASILPEEQTEQAPAPKEKPKAKTRPRTRSKKESTK